MRDHLSLKDLQRALGTSSPENAGQAFDPAVIKVVRVARMFPAQWSRIFADEWERQAVASSARPASKPGRSAAPSGPGRSADPAMPCGLSDMSPEEVDFLERLLAGRADRRELSKPGK